MKPRAVIAVLLAALLLAAGAGAWRALRPVPEIDAPDTDAALPLPPVPPRIAQGDRYEGCLAMLATDPEGAQALAEAWQTAGGGDGAEHCLALARIDLGDAEEGAALLEHLAAASHGDGSARAAIYGQATRAWLMSGDASHAYAAGTLALALSPDEPDLLIDRSIAAARLDRWRDAADDLTWALDRDPRRADALALRGTAWRHLDRLDLGRDDLDRALAADPQNAEALLERGIVRQRRDDATGARADWERAIALAPDSPTADLAQQNLALLEAGPRRP